MAVGEYLKELLVQRGISVSEMTNMLGMSSRNSLYRFFSGKQSCEKQRKILDDIIRLVPFSEEEKRRLNELFEDGGSGKFADAVKGILDSVFMLNASSYVVKSSGKPLVDHLSHYDDNGKQMIVMSGIRSAEIIQDMYNFLKYSPETHVYHYMTFPQGDILTAYEVLALIKLSEFKNYFPMEPAEEKEDGMCILSMANDGCRLQILNFAGGGKVELETYITDMSYRFLLNRVRQDQKRSTPIKKRIRQVKSYVSALGEVSEIEEGDSFYCEGAPCFGYLPPDILYDMFKGINFFGYPEEYPRIQQMIKLVRGRNERLYSVGRKRFVYDAEHIRQMLETGIAVDHVSDFPPMSIEQRRNYFSWLIDYLKKTDRVVSCRMLKDVTVRHSFVYEREHMLYMYRPIAKDGDMDVSVIMLRNKSVDEVMGYFSDYVWEKHTLSDEETRVILEELVREYLER